MRIESTFEILPADSPVPQHTEVRIENAQGDKFIAFSAPGTVGILDAVTQVHESEQRQYRDYGLIGDVHQWPIYLISGTVRIKEAD